MDLASQCALRVGSLVWRPGQGQVAFTVVCKATFLLQPGVSSLASRQEPVTVVDEYSTAGGPLRRPSDLLPFKKRPELLVVGHAYAPGGSRAPSFAARVVVDGIDKSVPVTMDRASSPDGWRVPLVGLGPLAPTSPVRLACLGRHAAGWDPLGWRDRPLPADIDLAYFNAAPPDQQRAAPFGEEQIYLENLHTLVASLSTRLAPVTPAAMVDQGSGPQPMRLRCDTLIIDTDRGLAMLVWRGHVPVDHPEHPGRVVVTASTGSAPPATTSPADRAALARAEEMGTMDLSQLGLSLSELAPFRVTPAGEAPARREPSGEEPSPLPFAISPPAPAPDAVQAPREPVSPWAQRPPVPEAFTPQPGEPMSSPVMPEPSSPGPELPLQPITFHGHEAPPPPSLLGAIRSAEAAEDEGLATVRPPPQEGSAVDPAVTTEEPPVQLADYPPTRCGDIAARLACDEASGTEILRLEGLESGAWGRVHDHWLQIIREDTVRSRRVLLAEYDAAYVRALEARRGRLEVDEYAALAEAAERGAVSEALSAAGLPAGAWPHIHRVWIERMVKDLTMARAVRKGIERLHTNG